MPAIDEFAGAAPTMMPRVTAIADQAGIRQGELFYQYFLRIQEDLFRYIIDMIAEKKACIYINQDLLENIEGPYFASRC